MARVILCTTKMARKPFCFPVTGQNIYSYEELCYYIQQYTALFQEDFVSKELIEWLLEEIEAKELADHLVRLKRENVLSRVYVLAILEAYPYFSAKSIKEIVEKLDGLRLKETWLQGKEYADTLYRAGCPKQARKIYDRLVEELPKTEENEKVRGAVWHGRGSCFAKNMQYKEASECFQKAFELAKEEISRKSYFMSLYLLEKKEVIQEEMETAGLDKKQYDDFIREMEEKEANLEYNQDYQTLQKALRLKEEGYEKQYQKKRKQLLTKWKNDYRDEDR